MRSFTTSFTIVLSLFAVVNHAAPYPSPPAKRQYGASSDRLVFAHFMIGITSNRKAASAYDMDFQLAKAAGIDAFALNIGTDPYTSEQLNLAYESAASNDMRVFISFDFNWFSTSDTEIIANLIREFGGKSAQLKVDGKVFVSSFAGDGLDVETLRQAVGTDIFFAPNFHPSQTPNPDRIDAALSWMAWDSDGNNRAPSPSNNLTTLQSDTSYTTWLSTSSKSYIAPISPWFSTHYGAEVPYSKNWVFPGDLLWYNRWNEILTQGPRFVEIVTWNDYGESHYIGPLSSPHTDDGASKWVDGMPHGGWLEMAKPYIKAYKAGSKDVGGFIEEEKLVYWYRTMRSEVECDGTDTVGARPEGHETLEDEVFVVALLKEAAKIRVVSGGNEKMFDAPAGASAWSTDMGVGQQKFSLERGEQEVLSETSLRDIVDVCPCGLYNYNAYVGTVPAAQPDSLDEDGLAKLDSGLKVDCTAISPPPSVGSSVGNYPATSPVFASSSTVPNYTSTSSTSLAISTANITTSSSFSQSIGTTVTNYPPLGSGDQSSYADTNCTYSWTPGMPTATAEVPGYPLPLRTLEIHQHVTPEVLVDLPSSSTTTSTTTSSSTSTSDTTVPTTSTENVKPMPTDTLYVTLSPPIPATSTSTSTSISTKAKGQSSTPPSTTTTNNRAVGGCTATITARTQIFPTNCLGSGQVWIAGGDSPQCCDGASPCCG